ncbi:f7fea631-2ac5-4392-b6f3-ae020d12e702 [Sclerotinia trifoliorum]|uniref:F7fea631-2ac5-4392-b6f3-ae020d12e702 n=1 Tax=Sclerotinia trifoliorum TaxID=28548 RepID=A0A8H2VM37_9HELO|nr:f7fea631-2ac5-4392-b6f3-ae020d12e702 [Sclerotinia trifoliorum]
MDSSPSRSSPPPPSSPSHTIAFPTFEALPTTSTTSNLPNRSRSRSNRLSVDAEPPQIEDLITSARRDSVHSVSSTSSEYTAEIKRLRAEVARHNQEVEESAIGLGLNEGSIAANTEGEAFNYRGVQSARPVAPLLPRRGSLPLAADHPVTIDLRARRGSQHSRSSCISSPTSATYVPPQIPSATYILPQLTSTKYVPSQTLKMNYQGFGDPNQPGQQSNSRQAPPSPGQGMAHTNGMNGQMNMAGMANMIGFPTPAGHQSDLNYIMVMVEELSRLLAANQKITDSILEKIGNVRQRAKDKNLTNDELLAIVSEELNAGSENLEAENSQLRRAIEQSKADSEENWKLVLHAAGILEDIKEKAHNYKFQHEKDTLAWHKSYRDQLAQERKENLELRCHIADMQAHAAKANDYINQLRRYASEHKIITELTTQVHQYKSERRFWKRMACVGLREDPSEWSDGEGGATGDIPEAEKTACASYIAEREEMARIVLGHNDDSSS